MYPLVLRLIEYELNYLDRSNKDSQFIYLRPITTSIEAITRVFCWRKSLPHTITRPNMPWHLNEISTIRLTNYSNINFKTGKRKPTKQITLEKQKAGTKGALRRQGKLRFI